MEPEVMQLKLLKYGMVSNEADKLADSVTTLETFLSKNLPVKSSMDPDQFLTACSSHPAIKSLFLHSLKKIIHGGQKKQDKAVKSRRSERRQTRQFCQSNKLSVQPKFWYNCVMRKCKFADYTKEKMARHYKEKHNYVVTNKDELPFDELQLSNIEEGRRGGKRSYCYRCSEKFANDSKLSEHLRAVHVPKEFKKYSCGECGEKFVTALDLQAHSKWCASKQE